MNKTLHKTFTATTTPKASHGTAGMADHLLHDELELLLQASKKLMQPRPEAVANLLKMARSI